MKTEKNILIAFLLNLSFSVLELLGGIFTNSVSILSDAVHDFGDALSIGISFVLEKISKKKPDDKYTYGYARYSILGAFITTTVLTIGSILVIIHGVQRLFSPEPINYNGMLLMAVIGVVINFLSAYFTKDGNSANQKAVNLHMLEDVLGWIVVLIGSLIIKITGYTGIDSILSIGVAIFILTNAVRNFKEILDLFLEKTPNGISVTQLEQHLCEINGVVDIHHIHLWSMDSHMNLATVHVVIDPQKNHANDIKAKIRQELAEHGINHVTIEIENPDDTCDSVNCTVTNQQISHHHHHH